MPIGKKSRGVYRLYDLMSFEKNIKIVISVFFSFLREPYVADVYKLRVYRSERAWANACELFRGTPSCGLVLVVMLLSAAGFRGFIFRFFSPNAHGLLQGGGHALSPLLVSPLLEGSPFRIAGSHVVLITFSTPGVYIYSYTGRYVEIVTNVSSRMARDLLPSSSPRAQEDTTTASNQ